MTGADLPRISLVTATYNQAAYIQATIDSIVQQNYPNLEYIIMDGGSTDGTVEILRANAGRLTAWVSEPDAGQYDALNKGFARTTGDIMAYLNSDDLLCPWALHQVAAVFTACPQVSWLTSGAPLRLNPDGTVRQLTLQDGYTARWFRWGWHLGAPKGWIQQESTFWRRSLWDAAGGGFDAALRYAGDFELWDRFWQHAPLYTIPVPLGAFRMHAAQKTAQLDAYLAEARQVLAGHADDRPSPLLRHRQLLAAVARYVPRLKRRFGGLLHQVTYDWQADRWRTGRRYTL